MKIKIIPKIKIKVDMKMKNKNNFKPSSSIECRRNKKN